MTRLDRKADRDAYLIRRFLPEYARDFYDAFRTLNLELIRLPETVSNQTIKNMRIAFWHESLDATFAGHPPREPICILLHHALEDLRQREPSGDLQRRSTRDSSQSIRFWLNSFLRLRERQMDNRPFATLEAWNEAGSAYGMLMYATLAAIPVHSSLLDHLASHVGKACDMVALLRGIPILTTSSKPVISLADPSGVECQQKLLLPLDVMAKAGLKEEDVFRKGPSAPGLQDSVYELASLAQQHVLAAREKLQAVQRVLNVDRHGRQTPADSIVDGETDLPVKIERGFWVLLHAVPCLEYLKDLERKSFDPFAVRRSWTLPLRMWAALRKRYI